MHSYKKGDVPCFTRYPLLISAAASSPPVAIVRSAAVLYLQELTRYTPPSPEYRKQCSVRTYGCRDTCADFEGVGLVGQA